MPKNKKDKLVIPRHPGVPDFPTEADMLKAKRLIAKRKLPTHVQFADCVGDLPREALFVLWSLYGLYH
jgi:hypothetical protein